MENCLFCKFNNGEIQVEKVFENENFFVIKDINPQAPIHLLAIVKHHYKTFDEMNDIDKDIFGQIVFEISKHQKQWGIEKGYRLIINQGEYAGQTIPHLHIHILGGKKLDEKF